MRVLTAPLMELGEFEEIKKGLDRQNSYCASLTGCMESQKLHMIYGLGEGFQNRLIITFSDLRVKEMLEEKYQCRDIIESQVGCAIGAHTGPGIIGIVFLSASEEKYAEYLK